MRTCLLTAMLALVALPCAADVLWQDDFQSARRYAHWGPPCWTVAQGKAAFTAAGNEAFLVTVGPSLERCEANTTVTAEKRSGASWVVAGLSLHDDPVNHWRLLLVEGPEGRRYFELVEMLQGEHQAQNGSNNPAARLESETRGDLQSWEYGQAYRLTLSLGPTGLTGAITDPRTGKLWQRSFAVHAGQAVRSGRVALTTNGLQGAFGPLRVEGPPPQGRSGQLVVKPGPSGSVAIVSDEQGKAAEGLEQAFNAAGYGVAVVRWQDLDKVGSPAALDLLVLADATRVPLAARQLLRQSLQEAGKVLCVGAPAMSELLAPSPGGWHGAREWATSYAKSLPRRAIEIKAGDWVRAAMDGKRAGTLTADPQSGEKAWQYTSEYQGWDGYQAPVPGAFDDEHRFLLFEAKGDVGTTQMSIECTERDGSRWIGVVELGPEWQSYLMRPVDFPYWKDSKSRNRGGSGDRVQPRDVVSLTFGLASSHTTKVKPGARAFWMRNLAAARDRGVPDPDFRVPDVEIISPSYKLYPMDEIAQLRASDGQCALAADTRVNWTTPAYSPVWRERGRGFGRGRAWRWVPVLEAYDARGASRGALISYMIGDGTAPNAVWGNVAVAEAAQALRPELLPSVIATARAMTRGCFLLDGGAEWFAYKPGESITLGATGLNTTRESQELSLRVQVRDRTGKAVFDETKATSALTQGTAQATWTWKPTPLDPAGYEVAAMLLSGGHVVDRISHRLEALRTTPARPEEFVRVEGSHFMLGQKKWFFKGINYWQSWVGGYPHLGLSQRSCYDSERVERDLAWLEKMGFNAISAVQALLPTDPENAMAYRDQLDFLGRCDRHGIKVFFFLRDGRPYHGGDVERLKEYITRAGLKNHPAIMCWELAWEPIETPWEGKLDFMTSDWNAWVVERYGSVATATADWGFSPTLDDKGRLPVPDTNQCQHSGAWDRYVAAFRRAFTDLISAKYRDLAEPLRQWDPQHLVSFRGGACGIPYAAHFPHTTSPGAAKHMDFSNPEGYNLHTVGWGHPTPPEDLRRGGLVTLFYRHLSREKPVVWMEFGYTVNGIGTDWEPSLVHLKPEQLQNQVRELESFYAMFIESGARGAAPWWLPGGFRLGENSDFGLIEPDGAERPVCEVIRRHLPRFETVVHKPADAAIEMDLDRHYADSWPLYSQQYLDLVKAGNTPEVRTAGTGTTSATCPLTAVGGVPYNGHNPPLYLNAEFNRLEIRVDSGAWCEVRRGERVAAPLGARIVARASVGNLGEASWLAGPTGQEGAVCLAGRREYGMEFRAPIAANTPYLGDATVPEFVLIPSLAAGGATVSFEMYATGRAHFGERRTLSVATQ